MQFWWSEIPAIESKNIPRLEEKLYLSPGNQDLVSKEKECRAHYIEILSSSMELIKQQCKIDWLTQGDDCTRFFFAKAKQRKISTCIYALQDANHMWVEGFDKVR